MRSKVKYFILIILIIVSAIRITVLNINAKDYKLKIENYKVEDTFVIKGYEYIIDGYSIVDADEMERLCGYRDERIDGKYAIVDMRYRKLNNDKSSPVVEFYLNSGTWNNGNNLQATMQLNSKTNENKEGDYTEYKQVFNLNKVLFTRSGWDKVDSRKYRLKYNFTYPYIIYVNLWE